MDAFDEAPEDRSNASLGINEKAMLVSRRNGKQVILRGISVSIVTCFLFSVVYHGAACPPFRSGD